MSGGINFKNDQYWGAAGWCFRAVIRNIAAELEVDDQFGLYKELTDENASFALNIEYFDTLDWSDEKAVFFYEKIVAACQTAKKSGPVGWSDPDAFPGYLEHFQSLAALAQGELERLKK